MVSAIGTPTFSIPLTSCIRAGEACDANGVSGRYVENRFVGDGANIGLKFLENPDRIPSFSWPVVLFGQKGTGKTAIARSVGARLEASSSKELLALPARDFCRRFADALETNSIDQFRQTFFKIGVLLLDQIEDFKKYSAAQNEFASLLDSLTLREIPVVITADLQCFDANFLTARLYSRLTAGLCLNINAPGRDARRILIGEFASQHGFELSEEMLDYLVDVLSVTCPRIRQFFVQFKTWLLSTGRTAETNITWPLITEFLSPPGGKSQRKLIDSTVRLVGREFRIKIADIKSSSRRQSTVLARGVAIYLLRRHFAMSYSRIGEVFGGRDHSTVMHALKQTERFISQADGEIRDSVKKIEQSIVENALLEAIS